MSGRSGGLEKARAKMLDAGVDPVAIETFAHYYRLLEHGETGMIPEATIDPVDMESLDDVEVSDDVAAEAVGRTVAIKLNGGLGTSMGMDRAKSLLCVRRGLSFLDIIARQALHLRSKYDARLPLLFMNSFRTSGDTLHALGRYDDLAVDDLPLEFRQNMEPKLLTADLTPAAWPKDPDLEWCPPGHGDLYTALRGAGLIDRLIEQGYRHVFVSNSDNLGAVPDPRVAGWFAASGAPFAIEAVRRTPSDRKGGHFARRKADGRIVLRETAQTLPEDRAALADLSRHRFTSTNNLWFDLHAMKTVLDERDGILGLPLIRNIKHLDPADPASPEVVQ
ncbi:UTP--glucose-1-phosphate uridylyltransferase, partial [Nocardioides albidus]|uniref:UTP--glucose-1-phosphate uridylyltransferase n=1 Tax=Nocardioides albidus TaxID=1517589 RepID=UPI001F00E987